MNRWISTIANLSVTILAVALLLPLQHQRFQSLTQQTAVNEVAEKQRLVGEAARLKSLKYVPGFGFDALIADCTLLNFFSYFGDDALRGKTGYQLSPDYFEVILDRDPYFWEAYFFLSTSTSLYAGMPDRTVAIFNDRLKVLTPFLPPESYLLWRYKATDELLFLGDSQAAKSSYQTGAQWAKENGSPEALDAANFYQQSIDFLNQDPNSLKAQISAWGSILSNALDEKTQKIAIARIRALGGDVVPAEHGGYRLVVPRS